ncbi:hypothetical protein V2J09_005914 [Rumex salicifolius]
MGNEQFDYGVNTPDEFDGNRDFMNSPARTSMVFPAPNSPGHSSSSSSSSTSPCRFFEHPVSKLDTLAGVAIKYGVEVADIKKMNGLVTDRQMFGLKTLRIPQPGRHPPSPSLSNGCNTAGNTVSGKTPPRRMLPDILDSFESLKATPEQEVSQAMSSLQGYYGLREESHPRRTQSEGFEMAVYNKEMVGPFENGASMKPSSGLKPPLSLHGKSRSLANGFYTEEDEMGNHVPLGESSDTDSDKWSDKPVRRRQKSEADFTSRIPEKILKESGISGWFSAITGKGLALRTKSSSRNSLDSEAEAVGTNANASGLLASIIADGLLGVRKSSSTPILQDEDNNSSISIWKGSWNLKPDLQALSNSAIAKPILDGWANPITGRKTKTALD